MDPPPPPSSEAAAAGIPSPYPDPTHETHYDGSGVAAATAAAALSQQHDSAASLATANGRKRRATGLPSNRGVANLTPEQLAKKRANDREAQRAIRERTRNTIERLEQRIQELESQQPYQELQRVVQERDQALRDCEDLRRKLAQVAGIAGSHAPASPDAQPAQPNLHELANVTAQQSPLPPLHQGSYIQPTAGQTYEQGNLHPDLRTPVSKSSSNSKLAQDKTLRKWSSTLDRPHAAPNGALQDQSRTPSAQMRDGERLSNEYLPDSPRATAAAHRSSSHGGMYFADTHIWSRLPLNGPVSGSLDSLIIDFVEGCRKKLANGTPMAEVLGPEYPSFPGHVRNPQTSQGQPEHAFSHFVNSVLFRLSAIRELGEQVAFGFIVFLLLRWIVCPNEANYSRLPEWLRPTEDQLHRRHPGWVDLVPWPNIRARLACAEITEPTAFATDEFWKIFSTKLNVNWPHSHDLVLQTIPPEGDPAVATTTLTPAFEAHLRDLRHWTVGTHLEHAVQNLISQDMSNGGGR